MANPMIRTHPEQGRRGCRPPSGGRRWL